MMRLIKFLGISLFTLLVLIAIAGGVWKYQLDSSIALKEPQLYEVERGDGVRVTLERLQQQGVIKWRWPLELLALWDKQRFSALKVGQFRLEPSMNAYQLIDKLSSNDVVSYTITIPEGRTFAVMRSLINNLPNVRHDSLAMSDAELMAAIGHEGEQPEGRFFPSTYRFSEGESDLTLFKRAYNTMHEMLEKAWQQRSEDLPYKTSYEALIMASLVEQEAAVPEERSQIAGVFVRRLEKNMRLQTDPTVVYGLNLPNGRVLTRDNLRTDNPFNTYRHAGLPPTPIALPGEAAIDAALHPADGDALYFVAMGNGHHLFSATLAEHNRAVNRYVVQPARAERSESSQPAGEQDTAPSHPPAVDQAVLFEHWPASDEQGLDPQVLAFTAAHYHSPNGQAERQAMAAALALDTEADGAITQTALATVLELADNASEQLDQDVVAAVSMQFAEHSHASDKDASQGDSEPATDTADTSASSEAQKGEQSRPSDSRSQAHD